MADGQITTKRVAEPVPNMDGVRHKIPVEVWDEIDPSTIDIWAIAAAYDEFAKYKIAIAVRREGSKIYLVSKGFYGR